MQKITLALAQLKMAAHALGEKPSIKVRALVENPTLFAVGRRSEDGNMGRGFTQDFPGLYHMFPSGEINKYVGKISLSTMSGDAMRFSPNSFDPQDMCYNQDDGMLYALLNRYDAQRDKVHVSLMQVNPETGASTLIGGLSLEETFTSPTNCRIAGEAARFYETLACEDGVLYSLMFPCRDNDYPHLVKIDPQTASVIWVSEFEMRDKGTDTWTAIAVDSKKVRVINQSHSASTCAITPDYDSTWTNTFGYSSGEYTTPYGTKVEDDNPLCYSSGTAKPGSDLFYVKGYDPTTSNEIAVIDHSSSSIVKRITTGLDSMQAIAFGIYDLEKDVSVVQDVETGSDKGSTVESPEATPTTMDEGSGSDETAETGEASPKEEMESKQEETEPKLDNGSSAENQDAPDDVSNSSSSFLAGGFVFFCVVSATSVFFA